MIFNNCVTFHNCYTHIIVYIFINICIYLPLKRIHTNIFNSIAYYLLYIVKQKQSGYKNCINSIGLTRFKNMKIEGSKINVLKCCEK